MKAPPLLIVLALAGCDRPADRDDVDHLSDRIDSLSSELASARSQIDKLEARNKEHDRMHDALMADAQSLQDQVNGNAAAANENAIKEMTAKGACGTRLVRDDAGVIYNEKIPCTKADLKK